MPRPTLQRPSHGEAVKALQRLLNRTGALLRIDGDFGRQTERAVREAQEQARLPATGIADESIWTWLVAQPFPSPDLCTEDVTFVVREEIGSRDYYDTRTALPHYPGEQSGVTIGIGYDLRFQNPESLDTDWGSELPEEVLNKLRPHLGREGCSEAVEPLQSIRIPFPSAWRVFIRRTLPRYTCQTRAAYPEFDLLPDGCRGALVSLVYNRGTHLDGDRRQEMKAICSHLKRREHWPNVADEIRCMKRLWDPSSGLCGRRDREAALWKEGLKGAGLA